MFKFIVSAGCSQLIREIQLYSVSGEAMSNALTRGMRAAGDTMRHYDTDPDHDSDTGWGGWGSSVCLHRADHGPGRDKNAKFYFPLPMSSNVPWLLGAAQPCLDTSACVALQQARPAPPSWGAGAAAAAGVYWIVSLTIAVVLLLLV